MIPIRTVLLENVSSLHELQYMIPALFIHLLQ